MGATRKDKIRNTSEGLFGGNMLEMQPPGNIKRGNTMEDVFGCGEGGHTGGRSERR